MKLTLFFSGKTCLSLRCSPFNLLPVILEVGHRGGAPHNSLLHMPTNGRGMCMQHSLSCVLPAHASNDTWLRSSMAFSHKSVSWQLRHSVQRALYLWKMFGLLSISSEYHWSAIFQRQSWALLSSTAHCCSDQRTMLFWPFCCHNKSYAAQQRKFGIFTASFLPIYLLVSGTLHSTHGWKRP